jgi:hypothetical protein
MWRFTISGAGPFPTGLLCIAKAWPATLEDADAMAASRGIVPRKVTVESPFKPDRDLWLDWGWGILSCKWER